MSETAPPQIVMLGASNLTRGIGSALAWARAYVDGPADIRLACGFGRSYGLRSRVLFRELPGITGCGLWSTLPKERTPTYALIADIGNDLAYDAKMEDIRAWLEACLERFAARSARTVVVQLPLATIRAMTPSQYWYLKRLVFTGRDVPFAAMQERATVLAGEVESLARAYGATLVEQPADWYGFDPIHITARNWQAAWGTILAPWSNGAASLARGRTLLETARYVYLRALPPEQRWLFGRAARWPQPAGLLPGGSRLWLH